MEDFILFCKSYRADSKRLVRLAQSVVKYNTDALPFYVAVPHAELPEFTATLRQAGCGEVRLISEESILEKTFSCGKSRSATLPPDKLQQVTKSELWRLGICKNYLVLDSDSRFIRPFAKADFFFDADTPYTVINEGRHALEFAARYGDKRFVEQYGALRSEARGLFGRGGRLYDFAPTPCIWSCAVWEVLYRTYAEPRGENLHDMIERFPCETQWYGEFLLTHPVIRIVPVEPLFKVFHFREQATESARLGETDAVLAANFMGVVSQSNWDEELDTLHRKQRPVKRFINRLRGRLG